MDERIQALEGENLQLRRRLQTCRGIVLRQEGQLATNQKVIRELVLSLSLARQWLLNIQRHIAESVLMDSVNPDRDQLSLESLADVLDSAVRRELRP